MLQSIKSILYPPQCLGCNETTVSEDGLCPKCWSDAEFIQGATCWSCGAPLMGNAPGDEMAECQACIETPRPWSSGASVLVYKGTGRRLVLGLKHGDRHDLVAPFSRWMLSRLKNNLRRRDVIVPVPIHWVRLVRRRFNQSALIAKKMARLTGARFLPDPLYRRRLTPQQEWLSAEERFKLQSGTMAENPNRRSLVEGRNVVLVDDVMTSGATLSEATRVLLEMNAARVDTVTLARVVKDS